MYLAVLYQYTAWKNYFVNIIQQKIFKNEWELSYGFMAVNHNILDVLSIGQLQHLLKMYQS